MPDQEPVVVVGAGWAGLAAAVGLSGQGVPVTLVEAAHHPGGRARRVERDGMALDNGQHVLLGAYRETLSLLRRLGLQEQEMLLRRALELRVVSPGQGEAHLRTPRLPAPLHLVTGLLSCRGFSPGERFRALGLCLNMVRTGFSVAPDLPVARWLERHSQPSWVRTTLWEPLCLAALNTPVEEASTRVFLRVLRDAFARRRRDSDLLLPRVDLGALLPDPALAYLSRHGAVIQLGRRVTAILVGSDGVRGVTTSGGTLPARRVILATSVVQTLRLTAGLPGLAPLTKQLSRLTHQPTTTVYLQYPGAPGLGMPMLGLTGMTGQWVFDHAYRGDPGLMAVVISAGGEHMSLGKLQLGSRIAAELAGLRPDWPTPEWVRVIREKRATFSCVVDVDALRPPRATELPGLWLAGDYTAGEYPATLEAAVRSGVQCAREICHEP